MQVFVPKWHNFLILKNAALIHSTRVFAPTNHFSSFHSTAASFQKWKSKFDFDVKGEKQQQPSKDYIRYVVRQKRSDSKKALKDLLLNTRCSPSRVQTVFSKIEAEDADRLNKNSRVKPAREAWGFSKRETEDSDRLNKKSRIKPAREAKRAHLNKVKNKHRREKKFEDFEEHERIFQETFGDRCSAWSFKPGEDGFDWRETSGHGYFRNRKYKSKIGMEFNDEPCFTIGAVADRRTLGLPLAGQIKIEDVKTAFRLSALKWHPDKNQGSSRAQAEEKFKLCADAYKSLCSALSAA